MYCKCEDKKEITNEAAGETFVVCSKNKGGCGLEIKESGKLITSDEDLFEEDGVAFLKEAIESGKVKVDDDIDELLSEFERAMINLI